MLSRDLVPSMQYQGAEYLQALLQVTRHDAPHLHANLPNGTVFWYKIDKLLLGPMIATGCVMDAVLVVVKDSSLAASKADRLIVVVKRLQV